MTTEAIRQGRSTRETSAPTGAPAPVRSDSAVLQEYMLACRDRDRWTLRRYSGAKRHQHFVLALKHLAKSVASDATAQLSDRHTRVAVRASIYSRRLLTFAACVLLIAGALSFERLTQLL